MTSRKPSGPQAPHTYEWIATNPPSQRTSPPAGRRVAYQRPGDAATVPTARSGWRTEAASLRCKRCGYFMDCSDYY